jgi:hypothetical protein
LSVVEEYLCPRYQCKECGAILEQRYSPDRKTVLIEERTRKRHRKWWCNFVHAKKPPNVAKITGSLLIRLNPPQIEDERIHREEE